ncbi:DegV family protein [Lacticigenium naphthae]|uniref:DegV family protein n=1 Tax=Lacticigenium naphthae TaxID=515351 RepID=UPI000414C2F2|nr:DegV family protein [Lacticigenium naphthae]
MNDQKIAILTDSGSDVPDEIVGKYNMKVLPLKIIYKDGEYIDKKTITAHEVFDRLEEEIPKTSLPDGEMIRDALDEIKAEGYEKVIAVTISSGLSGTHNMVRLIADSYEGLEVFILDSKNIGIASGFIAIEAAKLVEKNVEWSQIKEKLKSSISKSTVFFQVPTLEYLQKGGRIGLVSSMIGTLINLKPIISCNEEGIYHTVAKVRGKGTTKSLNKTIQILEDFVGDAEKYHLAVEYGGEVVREDAEMVKQQLKEKLPHFEDFYLIQVSPALGVHTGPGLIGVGAQILS